MWYTGGIARAFMVIRRVYNFLFGVGCVLTSPFYFLKMWRRGGWRQGFGQRFGFYGSTIKQILSNREVVWLHAVSVGEANICTRLVAALRKELPSMKMVVSTTTSTGMAELRRRLPAEVEKIYYPVDSAGCVRRALRAIHPRAVVLVEAEVWPNFLWHLADLHIPVFLVNARLSERSFRGYHRLRGVFRPLFAGFAAAGCQDPADAARLAMLGCRPDRIHVTGNLKFDAAAVADAASLDVKDLLIRAGAAPNAPVLVAGSTHAGEEVILAEMTRRLRTESPDLFLVLVPRHVERMREVVQELNRCGIRFVCRTELAVDTCPSTAGVECLVVNTTGELREFYRAASVVFVGKSLTARGGQNPIEPGALGKPMVFGPNMQNFTAVARAFVEAEGAIQVSDASQLEVVVRDLLGDEARRRQLGTNALNVVRANSGAVQRSAEFIGRQLRKEERATP